MKLSHLLAGLMMAALLTWPYLGVSGALRMRMADVVKVDEGYPGTKTFEHDFAGGERACVIVKGDHEPIVDVGIEIYDVTGNLLAKDDGKGDLAAVVWYPPEDGKYKIKLIVNPNARYNLCLVVIR